MIVQNGLVEERNVTHEKECFLGTTKLVNWVSLNGQRGSKNENHQMIYTYLNSAKAEDSSYTVF